MRLGSVFDVNHLTSSTNRSNARLEAKQARKSSGDLDEKDVKLERDEEAVLPVLSDSHVNVFIKRSIPPFVPSQDIVRGIVYAGQAALSYAFMLAAM